MKAEIRRWIAETRQKADKLESYTKVYRSDSRRYKDLKIKAATLREAANSLESRLRNAHGHFPTTA
jgi:predicted  nucleic acid-binding Zn-ribbon protein